MAEEIDFEAEGLLDDLEGGAREERLELLEWLARDGFKLEQLRESSASGLLPFLPAERIVTGEARYSGAELLELSGADPKLLIELRRSHGLPAPDFERGTFGDLDLESAKTSAAYRELGLSEDQMLATGRVLGRALGRAAEVMRTTVLQLVLEPGASEKELAVRYALAVEALMPLAGPMVDQMLRMHLRHMVATEAVDAVERSAGVLPGARDITVAFADLAGFTRMGETVPPDELSDVAERLVALTTSVMSPPVRLVKTIGDAAMLVSPEPEPLLATALDLVEAVDDEGEDFPQVHAGLALGPALSRSGDWYGRPVNLASRVTGIARPGSVLVTGDVRDAIDAGYRWSFAGARSIKGVGEVPLFRARTLAPTDDAGD